MRAHSKGTPVRVVVEDLVGEVIGTMANGDDFGYMVGYGGKKPAVDKNNQPISVWSSERFFPAHEVEALLPIVDPVSVSLSGTKEAAIAQADKVEHPLLKDALKYLVGTLAGDQVSISASVSPNNISISGSSWIATKGDVK